jgi:ribulose-phosphate 3-epimerase
MNKTPIIAPSLLSANFGNLEKDISMLNNSEADWLHIDVMDGVFVPNISFGFPVLKFIQKLSAKPLDVHLMIINPERYIERFREHGAEIITVHFEACTHLHRTVQAIKDSGAKAGVSINPHTPVELLFDILPDLDLVLIMSVNPGYGGQSFIENSFNKIERLSSKIIEGTYNTLIEVDGGVTLNNAARLIHAGADALVAGNTVFSSQDPAKTISQLKNL